MSGSPAIPLRPKPGDKEIPWTTNKGGGDGFILKFDRDGNFKMRIGGTPTAPDSNSKDGGLNGTPLLYRPADMVVDPKTNRLYVADGYANRRILIVDADTGKYIGHFGAYGNNPIDDAAAAAAGTWPQASAKGETKPAFFRNPVHCVKIADDGKIYVCDRGNDRIQVFDSKDASLGKECSNPNGEAGKCGFVTERFISAKTYTQPVMPGTAVSMNFSPDKAQSCLYIGDNTNQTIYILGRDNLEQLGRLGHGGRMAGDFHWLHQVSLDSQGNIYTGEVDTGKRVQKFVRYGANGCSGTGTAAIGGEAADANKRCSLARPCTTPPCDAVRCRSATPHPSALPTSLRRKSRSPNSRQTLRLDRAADRFDVDHAIAHHAAIVEDVLGRHQPVADVKRQQAILAGARDLRQQLRVPPDMIDVERDAERAGALGIETVADVERLLGRVHAGAVGRIGRMQRLDRERHVRPRSHSPSSRRWRLRPALALPRYPSKPRFPAANIAAGRRPRARCRARRAPWLHRPRGGCRRAPRCGAPRPR